ncbi:MAG: MaoC family dehydratase, partial [Gaiella sp.]
MALRDLVGRELGPSSWLEVTQARVDEFARATGDDQWIHVDPERCVRESPFGRTIAHGYLTLSLCAMIVDELVPENGAYSLSINYGSNRVRFPAPVPVGSRIRGRVRFDALDEVAG